MKKRFFIYFVGKVSENFKFSLEQEVDLVNFLKESTTYDCTLMSANFESLSLLANIFTVSFTTSGISAKSESESFEDWSNSDSSSRTVLIFDLSFFVLSIILLEEEI